VAGQEAFDFERDHRREERDKPLAFVEADKRLNFAVREKAVNNLTPGASDAGERVDG
jgi:hypothetical protein